MNELTPPERREFWSRVLNKFSQFARDHGYDPTYVYSREARLHTGEDEHLHMLVHVPPELCIRFDEVVAGWFPLSGEIDIQPADYRITFTDRGKRKSRIGYVLKNSPQAAYKTARLYKKGGPILGKRAGCTRNIDAPARERWFNSRRADNDNLPRTENATQFRTIKG